MAGGGAVHVLGAERRAASVQRDYAWDHATRERGAVQEQGVCVCETSMAWSTLAWVLAAWLHARSTVGRVRSQA